MEANFSVLVMSIASSAAITLGLTPDPQTNEFSTDPQMAKFNIDLLLVLKEKTQGHMTPDEDKLMSAILGDLQLKFMQLKNSPNAGVPK